MSRHPHRLRAGPAAKCGSIIRTLKENLLWIRTFATVVELVEALGEFKRTYNEKWLIGRHRHRTPSQVRRDLVSGKSAAA